MRLKQSLDPWLHVGALRQTVLPKDRPLLRRRIKVAAGRDKNF